MASSSNVRNITEDYTNLSINDKESEGLILGEIPDNNQSHKYSLCMVDGFLTDRKVNFTAMRDTLSSIWRPVKGVFMEETNIPNLFIFKFFHELDLQRVLDDGPWTFNNQASVVKKLEISEQLNGVKLDDLYIWIQVYNLPIRFNSEFILQSIDSYVGKFVSTDPNNFQELWRKYVRVKVAINVHKPLKSKMRIKKAEGEWMWIQFKYERMPTFCFYYGLIGRSEKLCEKLFDDNENQGFRKYDGSLRAPVKKLSGSGSNQWLRNSEGEKLMPMKTGATQESTNGKSLHGKDVTDVRDLGEYHQDLRSLDESLLNNDNQGHDMENSNEGIIISKQKRARTKEDVIDADTEMGHGLEHNIGLNPYWTRPEPKKLGIGVTYNAGPPATMSIITWNCRGLVNPYTVQVLLDLVQMKKPALVFLMETVIDNNRVEAIRGKLNYEGLFTVAGSGHGGGLALFWKYTNTVEVQSYSHNYIDTEINLENIARWRLTCHYGYSERTRHKESWDMLKELAGKSSLPWTVVRDFNDMLRCNEKRGKHNHPNYLLNGFLDALFDCGISDLEMKGHPFTWEKSPGTPWWVEERLDRVCVNDDWRGLFPSNKVENLIAPSSDHSAIYLQIQVGSNVASVFGSKMLG